MSQIDNIIKLTDKASSEFVGSLTSTERRLFSEVIKLTKELKLNADGSIVASAENLKIVSSLQRKLDKVALNSDYLKEVKSFVDKFGSVATAQMAYFSTLAKNIPNKTKYAAVQRLAADNVVDMLASAGLKANVTAPLKDMIVKAVTSGLKYTDLTDNLRTQLTKTESGEGSLSRYARTYSETSINQFAGQNNKLFTDDLGLEWFMYVGSNKTTTREFCEHLVEKKYVHKSEIETIVSGNIDGYECRIYDKTGLPLGMIEGTNAENFQVYCGGWNCGHKLVPVSEVAVPKEIRDRFKDISVSAKVSNQKEKLPFIEYQGKYVNISKEEAIRKLYELNQTADYENSYSILANNEVYFKEHRPDKNNMITFSPEERRLLKGADLYHNHPKGSIEGGTFSKEDMRFCISNKLRSINTIYEDKIYSLKPKKNVEYDLKKFEEVYGKFDIELQNSFFLDDKYTESNFYHELVRRVAKEMNLGYSVKTL